MTEYINERPQIIELRRRKSALEICGKGTLILLVWSLVRFLMDTIIGEDTAIFLKESFENSGVESASLYWGVFAVLMVIISAIHVYVSLMAISEARGKTRGYFYLFICALVLAMSIYNIVNAVIHPSTYKTGLDNVVDILLTIVSIIVEFGVIRHSLMIKKLRKELGGEVK